MQALDSHAALSIGRLLLFFENRPGVMSSPSKEEHQIVLQLSHKFRVQVQGLDRNRLVRMKLNEIDAPKSSSIFILLPHGFTKRIPGDLEGPLRQFVLRHWHAEVGGESL